jgi:hypothetical protein
MCTTCTSPSTIMSSASVCVAPSHGHPMAWTGARAWCVCPGYPLLLTSGQFRSRANCLPRHVSPWQLWGLDSLDTRAQVLTGSRYMSCLRSVHHVSTVSRVRLGLRSITSASLGKSCVRRAAEWGLDCGCVGCCAPLCESVLGARGLSH